MYSTAEITRRATDLSAYATRVAARLVNRDLPPEQRPAAIAHIYPYVLASALADMERSRPALAFYLRRDLEARQP